MSLGTLGASLFENLFTGCGERELEQVSILNAASFFNKFEIQKFYQNEP